MQESDAEIIYHEYFAQGWHPSRERYETYFKEQEEHKRLIFVAEYQGEVAGYTTILLQDTVGPFANKGIPVIVDFNVFIRFQRKEIGTTILDIVENYAGKIGDTISLSVGLHSGYGTAQRMYIKRGYIPDGTGVWYNNQNLDQYVNCRNDDSLVLYLSKKLLNTK
jgi:ribosomal protein S18 acetylase RimI-like enzyme